MLCNCCEHQDLSLSHFYNIENVRPRFIPTYFHTQIFAPSQSCQLRVRCSPTFHSQVMITDKYGVNKNKGQKNWQKRSNSTQKIVCKNVSKMRKQQQLYHQKGNCCYKSSDLWYDPAKSDLFKKLQGQDRNYSHERKQIDLSSNPVFGGSTLYSFEIQDSKKIQSPTFHQKEDQKNLQNDNVKKEQELLKDKIQQPLTILHSEIPKLQNQLEKKETKQEIKQKLNLNNSQKKIEKVKKQNGSCLPTFTVVRKRKW